MRKITLLFSLLFLISFSFFSLYNKLKLDNQNSTKGIFLSQNMSASNENDYFDEAISYWPKISQESKKKIYAGVVPHHFPASPMIANFFSQLSGQRIANIYLLAPNHEEKGQCRVFTDSQSKTNLFDNSQLVCADDQLIEDEHAVSIIKPYIDYYLDSPNVVNLVLSNYLSMEEVEHLVEIILQNKTEDDIIIASVDFSHYISYEDASRKDKETLTLIKNNRYKELLKLDHENLDSPESIVILLKIMESIGVKNFDVIANENFLTQSEDTSQGGTSYFEMIW